MDDGELHNIEARRTGRSGELILDSDMESMVSGTSQVYIKRFYVKKVL